MKKRGIIDSVNNDGTVDISLIDENMTVLKGVVIEQLSASSQTERGEVINPKEQDIAILEGDNIRGYTVTGYQNPVEKGSMKKSTDESSAEDKISYGPDGVRHELLSGGIIRTFINDLSQFFLTRINNTAHFIIENLKIVFPNMSFLINSDLNKSEVTFKFLDGSTTKNEIFINEKKIRFNINNKATVIFDTSDTATNLMSITLIGTAGNVEFTADKAGILTFEQYNRINLGKNATQPLLLGWKIASWCIGHKHPANNTPPIDPFPINAFSSGVFIKE